MWELTIMKYLDSLEIMCNVMLLLLHFNHSKCINLKLFKFNNFIEDY